MKFFISYSKSDELRVRDIKETLARENILYFEYSQHIKPGQIIHDAVLREIQKATHMLVVISSSTQVSNWVWYEVGVASGIGISIGKRIVIIPYLVNDDANVPDFVSHLHYMRSLHELSVYVREELQHLKENVNKKLLTEDAFDFYGFQASIKMIDFCKEGYSNENIKFRRAQTESIEIPSNQKKMFDLALDQWTEKLINQEIYDNKDLVGLSEYIISRVGVLEKQGVTCEIYTDDYIKHRAAVDVYKSLALQQKKKAVTNAIELNSLRGGHEFYGRAIALSMAIITQDNKLVFHRRSNSVSADRWTIMCGYGECAKEEDLNHEKGELNFVLRAAIRGAEEEFGISVPNPLDCISIHGFCLNRDLFEWYFIGIYDLRNTSEVWDETRIRTNISTAWNKDKFEISEVQFVPYEPLQVFRFLRNHKNEFVNYGVVVSICAMICDSAFSWEDLKSAALSALGSD